MYFGIDRMLDVSRSAMWGVTRPQWFGLRKDSCEIRILNDFREICRLRFAMLQCKNSIACLDTALRRQAFYVEPAHRL
jgi:hypothetical protein